MAQSLTLKLDPDTIYPYVCEVEREKDNHTTFFLKSLNILQYRICEELFSDDVNVGEYGLKVLEYGLIGWDNFAWDDVEVIPFDLCNIGTIPYSNQLELFNNIISLSEVDSDLIDEMIYIVKWSDWLSKSKNPDQWTCEYCAEKKLANTRNCDGSRTFSCKSCDAFCSDDVCPKCNGRANLVLKYRFSNKVNDFVTKCPVSLVKTRAIKLVNLVNYIDHTKSLPMVGGALEQSHFYYMARTVVLSEQNSLMKDELDKMKKDVDKKK